MQAESIQAIIVLGAGVNSAGEPSPHSALRAAKAVELAQAFASATVIMSGNSPAGTSKPATTGTEAAAMKKYAESLGLEPKRVLLENNSRDTLTNALYTKNNYLQSRKLSRVMVVTSGSHVPRAEYLFTKVLGSDYAITFVSAGGTPPPGLLAHEERSLAFYRALLDTATSGDDVEIERRMNEWLGPDAQPTRFTLEEWYTYVNDGVALPAFPDYA